MTITYNNVRIGHIRHRAWRDGRITKHIVHGDTITGIIVADHI